MDSYVDLLMEHGGSMITLAKGNRSPQVRKACAIGRKLEDLGIRRYGIVRIDSASSPAEWAKDPVGNTKKIADTFRKAADIAESTGERLAAEGEICWGGMHSVKRNVELLEMVDRPKTVGFQADMAHTPCSRWATTRRRIAFSENFDWTNREALDAGLRTMTDAGSATGRSTSTWRRTTAPSGSGSHDKTGRHCLPFDPNGKLDIVEHAGFWLRDKQGKVTRNFQHICWDGCMFPNAVMTQQKTWDDVLGVMAAVRDAYGWD
jgi:hypothetical protein